MMISFNWNDITSGNFFQINYLRIKFFLDPPEDVRVSPQIVKVVELMRPDPVKCFGRGHPTLSYEWKKNLTSEPITSTEDLNLPPLKREESGRYICEAGNKHGKKTAEVFFDVLCEYD